MKKKIQFGKQRWFFSDVSPKIFFLLQIRFWPLPCRHWASVLLSVLIWFHQFLSGSNLNLSIWKQKWVPLVFDYWPLLSRYVKRHPPNHLWHHPQVFRLVKERSLPKIIYWRNTCSTSSPLRPGRDYIFNLHPWYTPILPNQPKYNTPPITMATRYWRPPHKCLPQAI